MLIKTMNVFLVLGLILSSSAALASIPAHPDQVPRINVADLRALQSQQSVVFVDTRTPGQWQQAVDKIPGAQRITSQAEFDEFKRTVPADTAVVTYCT
jgi:rhodanese-related sulfurtransferase